MITVNSRFHTLIKAAGARTRARIYFIDNTVNCTNDTAVRTNGTLLKRNSTDTDSNGRIAESGIELYDLYNKEQNLTIGGSVSGQFKITFLNTDGGLNNFTYGRCKVYLDVYDEENSAWLSCPLGVFIIEQPVKSRIQLVEASGYDQMQYFDEIADPDWFSGLFSSAKTLNQIYSALVTQVSSVCGVTITPANTDMLNKTVSYSSAPFEPVEMTYREILNWIAEASGTIARFNRNGVLQLKWLANIGSEYAIGADALGCGVFSTDISEYECAVIDKLQVKASESDYGSVIGTGENAYVITDNPFLYGSTSAQVTTRSTPIYNRLHGFGAYTPLAVDLIADPSVEAGDIISVTRNGETYALPIFQQTLTWKGGYIRGSLQSSGTPNRLPVSAQNRYEFRSKKSVHELVVTTDELRSDITSVSDNLATNYPTTETMNSAIQQSAAAIDLSVSQRFDALSIGGTNFLLNSAFDDATTPYADHGLDKWNNNGSADIYTRQADGIVCGRMRVYQKGVSGSASVSQTFYPRVKDDPAGTTYTVSGDFSVSNYSAGTDSPSLLFIINGYYDDGGESVYTTGTLVKGSRDLSDCGFDWERREFTVRFDQRLTNAVFMVFARDCNCNLYWKDLKIEHGNTATAWSPAPEDYATTGEAAALQAQITVNATNIESKVSQTDYTGATIASKINQSASTVEIEADHINLNGIVTTNSGFMIDQNGYMTANGATIGSSGTDGENVPVSVKIENGIITIYRNDVLVGRFGTGASYDGNTYRSGVSLTGSDGSAAELSTDRFVLHEKYGTDKYWRTLIDGGTFGIYNSNRAGNLNEIFFTASPTTVTPQGSITSVNGIETFGAIDATNSDVILTSNGDLSKTGTRQVVNGSATTVATGSTYTTLTSITLPAGKWIVYASAQFGGTSATGLRVLIISTAENSSTKVAEWAHDRRAGISGSNVYANCMHIADLTAETTLYLNVIQTSGASITAYGRVVAMRIA